MDFVDPDRSTGISLCQLDARPDDRPRVLAEHENDVQSTIDSLRILRDHIELTIQSLNQFAARSRSRRTLPSQGTPGPAAEIILAAIRANPQGKWTTASLAQETGLKFKTVRAAIFDLRKKGKIGNFARNEGYLPA